MDASVFKQRSVTGQGVRHQGRGGRNRTRSCGNRHAEVQQRRHVRYLAERISRTSRHKSKSGSFAPDSGVLFYVDLAGRIQFARGGKYFVRPRPLSEAGSFTAIIRQAPARRHREP